MAQYGQAVYAEPILPISATGVITQAIAEIVASPTSRPIITEIGLMVSNAGGASNGFIGLGVPSSNGQGGQLHPWGGVALDPSSAPQALVIYNAWTKQPGAPTSYLRRISTGPAANIPNPAWFLRFPRGLAMSPGQHLVVYSICTAANRYSLVDMWLEWDE